MVSDVSFTASDLEAMKASELKEVCRELGLRVSGRKQELVDRILEATAEDDDILILESNDDSEPLTESSDSTTSTASGHEVQSSEEDEVFEAILDEEPEKGSSQATSPPTNASDRTQTDEEFSGDSDAEEGLYLATEDDEILDAEIFEAELIEDESDEDPASKEDIFHGSKEVRLAGDSIFATLTKPSSLAAIMVIIIFAGGGYWYYSSNLDPFVADPIEYGDGMEFAISSGSFDVEGEEMIRELDNRLNGALSDICEEFHVSFTGTGSIQVSQGTKSDLLDQSDTNLIGAVQARDAYGLTFLAVEQQLNHDLSASISSKTFLGDKSDNLCTVPVGPISGYSFDQSSTSWTELTSKALLSTHSRVNLNNQGETTAVEALSFGVPDDALSDFMPELLLPLKPVELTPMFGNSLLKEGETGNSGNWRWIVGGTVSVAGEMGLQVNLQHTEIEDCIGRANMVLYVVPSSPWAVQQQVDIHLEKSRYDSPECGVFTEYLLDRALPEGSISLQYTMVTTTSSDGDGMIDWQSAYGNRPSSSSGSLPADENWGASGTHMPDRSSERDWTLEQAVTCIINHTLEAEEASTALASAGYVYRATDDRSHGVTEWNVSWVDDNDAGWVRVEERPDNCTVLAKDSISEEDRPAHRRESIPETATLELVEIRLIDSNRYPILSPMINGGSTLKDDASLGYLLTVPPEAGDLLDLLDGYQEGTVVVFGQREWTDDGLDHSLVYGMDGETGRMAGWVKTSTTAN